MDNLEDHFHGAMGLCFLLAIASGVVVYGPFVRRLDFGTIRPRRRLYWLDLHHVLGIVILAWTLVVGVTVVSCST
ncbi:PepSY domain-containing protein [Bradyrhizobium mercantei]|uniref:PepSY domain-containing protein n=1 Tax=Bradyrhizobium mercantei TaxID=1904807 RepID=UPI0009765104